MLKGAKAISQSVEIIFNNLHVQDYFKIINIFKTEKRVFPGIIID